jgi:hypothetical protein
MAKTRSNKQASTETTTPASTSQAGEITNGAPSSMMEGVRRAMATLGNHASTEDIQNYLKDHFNIEMKRKMVSDYRASINKKAKTKRKGRAKPRARIETAPVARTSSLPAGVSIDDLKTIKDLTNRLGADKVHELVDLFAE